MKNDLTKKMIYKVRYRGTLFLGEEAILCFVTEGGERIVESEILDVIKRKQNKRRLEYNTGKHKVEFYYNEKIRDGYTPGILARIIVSEVTGFEYRESLNDFNKEGLVSLVEIAIVCLIDDLTGYFSNRSNDFLVNLLFGKKSK